MLNAAGATQVLQVLFYSLPATVLKATSEIFSDCQENNTAANQCFSKL